VDRGDEGIGFKCGLKEPIYLDALYHPVRSTGKGLSSVTYPFITKESQKTWESLKKSNYDWSHQAMDHWSERVKGKCKTNNSYAIAHGLT